MVLVTVAGGKGINTMKRRLITYDPGKSWSAFVWMAWVALKVTLIFVTWNWIMPVLFGLPIINWWEAFGLNLLTGLFFRSVPYGEESP